MSKIISPYTAPDEQRLMTEIWDPRIAEDPEAFVMFVFPWGKEGTPLQGKKGPKKWQREELRKLKETIAANKALMARGLPPVVDKFAMASGRGPGKSTLVAWVTLWAMSTILGGSVVLSANTEDQLKDKTMAEVRKWHTLSIHSHWFEPNAMSLRPAPWFGELLKTQLKIDTTYYYAKAQLWSEENPDAFAGLHNQYGTFLIFDEASGIPAPIWKVSEGFFTDLVLHRYHWVFSNPRRNSGPFFECFHKLRNRWRTRQIDSRTVEDIDQAVLAAIVEDYGADSDTTRMEVTGQFPRQGDKQFISNEIVTDSIQRELLDPKDPSNAANPLDNWAPLIMGVDPARFGDDCSVIRFRQGRNARVIAPIKLKNVDNMTLANRCAELIQKYDPDAVCIDAGNGTGVIDRLRELKYKVHEVWFGSSSPKPQWADFRTYLWAEMRDWLRGACIDADTDLRTDLTAPEYDFVGSSDVIRLESKEQMKDRGFASPDNGDALACTFAVKVAPRNLRTSMGQGSRREARIAAGVTDYSPFG